MANNDKIALLLEAEARGILPPEKKALLSEARARGLVPGGSPKVEEQKSITEEDLSGILQDVNVSPTAGERSPDLPKDWEADLRDRVQESNKPSSGPLSFLAPNLKPAFMNYADTASAGVGMRGAAGLDALIRKLSGQNDSVVGERSLGDYYDESLDNFQNQLDQMNKEHPWQAAAGDTAGFVGPGAFGSAFRGAGKIPFIAKLLGSGKVGQQLIGTALRGGGANALYGQLEEDFDTGLKDRGKEFAGDFAEGAAWDAGMLGGLKGLRVLGNVPGHVGRWAKGFLKRGSEKLPLGVGDFIKEGRLNKFTNKIDDVAAKSGASDIEVAGREVVEKLGGIKDDVFKNYNKLTGEVLNKYGDKAVSAETLRKGIMRELRNMGAVDAKGNVIDNAFISTFDQELKPVLQRLASFSDELVQNPSLGDLDRIVKGVGKLAKFDSSNRGAKEQIFGALYNDARTTFLDGIDSLMTNPKGGLTGELSKGSLAAARKGVAKNMAVSSGPIGKLAKKAPEEVVRRAKGTGKLNLGSVVDEALSANSAYKDPLKQAVIADIVDSAKDPRALKKVMDIYKDVLPKLMGKDEMEALLKLTPNYKAPPGWFMQKISNFADKIQGGNPNPGIIETLTRAGAPAFNSTDRGGR